jgi:hypothetical protein
MATTYQFKGETNAVPYGAPGYVVLKKFIDFADLVLNPQKLALASLPNVGLSTFAGMASGDTIQLFHIPAGFVVKAFGMYPETIDTVQAGAKLAAGDGAQTAGFMAANLLTDTVGIQTILTDAYGSSSLESRQYLVADTIDILSSVAAIVDAKVHFYCMGFQAFDLLGADV